MIRARSVIRATQGFRSLAKNAPRISGVFASRMFSVSSQIRAESPQAAATELASALRAEQKIELETAQEVAEEDSSIADWAKNNHYSIVETPGSEQIQLIRQISDSETVRVFFSCSDVVNAEGLLDEAPPFCESESNPDAGEIADEEDSMETPVRVNIVVERPNGALGIEGVVQDDLVLVESVIAYANAKLALEESAEADYTRRQAYQGPPFGVLDPSVQAAVQQYLEARSLDGDFALFVQEYASFRENKEYIKWLGRIAEVVE